MAPSDLDMVISRLFEFFGWRTPWHRRLWGVNTLTAAAEAADVGEQVLAIGQGEESLRAYRRWIVTEVDADGGIGTPHSTKLQAILSGKVFEQQSIHELRQI